MSSKKVLTPLKQTTLNFGQRALVNKFLECKECGMMYNVGDKRDEQLHAKYHNEMVSSCLKYTSGAFKMEKVVQDFVDGKVLVVEYSLDSDQSIKKSLEVLEYVDIQLGINELCNDGNHLDANLKQRKKSLINTRSKFYFFVDKTMRKIVGFCLAEQIDKAFPIKYLNGNENTFSYDDEICNEEVKKAKVFCGINRIWVAPEMRNKKIATRLLDSVCLNFFYVFKLTPAQLAFSDPTPNGRMLAKSYCKNDSFLIYNSGLIINN